MRFEKIVKHDSATRIDLHRVADVVDRAVAEQRLVGAVVLIARHGQLLLNKAAGFADLEAHRSMSEDSIFLFSSLTKPIVTAATMALVDSGELRLDDPLSRWIPEFQPKLADGTHPTITIRQLLTHTAGLTYGLFQPSGGTYEKAKVSDGLDQPGLGIDEQLARLQSVPLEYAPGSSWGYSLSIDVLGEVLARAAGTSLPSVIEERITGPLRMRDTGFTVRHRDRFAIPYIDGNPPHPMRESEVIPFGTGAGITYSPSRIFDPKSYPSGGAGMAGTAKDFVRFLEAVRRGGAPILSLASARAMMSNQIGALRIDIEPTGGWAFGFGGAVLMNPNQAGTPQSTGTWKWGGVYGHHWFVDPVKELTLVSLSNTTPEGFVGAYANELLSAVYASIADDG